MHFSKISLGLRSLCVASILVLVLAAGRAEASCGNSVRVQPEDSECFSGTHNNEHYDLRNQCPHIIRVKIDIANGSDRTEDVPKKEGNVWGRVTGSIDTSWNRYIRDVTCCSDYSSCDFED